MSVPFSPGLRSKGILVVGLAYGSLQSSCRSKLETRKSDLGTNSHALWQEAAGIEFRPKICLYISSPPGEAHSHVVSPSEVIIQIKACDSQRNFGSTAIHTMTTGTPRLRTRSWSDEVSPTSTCRLVKLSSLLLFSNSPFSFLPLSSPLVSVSCLSCF